MTLYKSKILDNILLKFKGNISVYWADLHGDKKIFSDIHQDYYIVENNINFLVGDGKLKRNNINNNEYLTLTDTGFATMTDLENLGYVTKARKGRRETKIKYIGFVLAIATFILLCFRTFIPHLFEGKSDKFQPIEHEQLIIPQGHNETPGRVIDSVLTKHDPSQARQTTKDKAKNGH